MSSDSCLSPLYTMYTMFHHNTLCLLPRKHCCIAARLTIGNYHNGTLRRFQGFPCFEAIGDDDRGGVCDTDDSSKFFQWKTQRWTTKHLVVNVKEASPRVAAVARAVSGSACESASTMLWENKNGGACGFNYCCFGSAISGSEGLQHPKFQTFLYIGSMEYVGGVAARRPNYWAHPQNW